MIHRHTPSLIANDGRGLPVRQVAYLRAIADAPVETLITRLHHDTAGRWVEQRDPRLSVANFVNVFGLSDQPLKIVSVDADTSLILPGLAGEELQRWDARGNHWRTTFDSQLRAVRLDVNAMPGVEKMTYADATQDPGHNLRGQMIELEDSSGSLKLHGYALTGPALHETRTFHDGKAYVSRRTFSPLGTVLETIDAASHKQQSTYDVAGQLIHTRLQINGQSNWQPVLIGARYNPAGQIIEQQTGNEVLSRWLYRSADGRLHRHCAKKASGETLQDFEYAYDRMGNITRILDHAYTRTFFRNQQVDGHREFSYDSLYRLIRATGYSDAPPKDNPGRPQPTDPDDRRNYIETYEYDPGNNLIKTTHERDGANHSFEMCIDPASNRGVRWKPGDPPPDFAGLFDPAGNLLALQPGQPMQWNPRGELEKVTLLDRNGSSANDEEYYRYSQGERVYKRHETHTTKLSHFHEVRYLPGLEIRTKDNGEELHVITLDIGPDGARCLHWEKDPDNIGPDQLRFTLTDHLGSAVKELGAQAQLISEEGYLPFGGTAFYAKRSAIEVAYKTLRYSGREMDVTSLYYYGARYYAPWLGRWISADPEGPVDGPNLYAFVENNPQRYVDLTGNGKWEALNRLTPDTTRDRLLRQANFHFTLLESVSLGVRDIEQQVLNHRTGNASGAISTAKRTGFFLAEKGGSFAMGAGLTAAGAAIGIPGGPLGMVIMGTLGFLASKALGTTTKTIGKKIGFNTSVSLQPDRLKSDKLLKMTRADTGPLVNIETLKAYNPMTTEGRALLRKEGLEAGKDIAWAAGGKVPYAGPAIKAISGTRDILKEVKAIGQDLAQEQIDALDSDITALMDMLLLGSERLIERATLAGETQLLGRSLERIRQKTEKRRGELRDLRTVLHSRSARFTKV